LKVTTDQKTLVKGWVVCLTLVTSLFIFEDDRLIVRGAFAVGFIYLVANAAAHRRLQRRADTPQEIISKVPSAKRWVIGCIVLEMVVCIMFLLSGRNLGELLPNAWSLALVFVLPISYPLLLSQMRLYRVLGTGAPVRNE